jgi:hypothetical protein
MIRPQQGSRRKKGRRAGCKYVLGEKYCRGPRHAGRPTLRQPGDCNRLTMDRGIIDFTS